MTGRAILVTLLPILPLCLGCSVEPGAAGDGDLHCSFPYDTWNGLSPTVSLRIDLLSDVSQRPQSGGGVMRRACAFSSCHDGTSVAAGLFLGPRLRDREQNEIALTDMDIARLFDTMDGLMRPSKTMPSMEIVKPGDPVNSLLIRKIDGCFSDIERDCTPLEPPSTSRCGDTMPAGSELLSSEERDLFRRWVIQGARNN